MLGYALHILAKKEKGRIYLSVDGETIFKTMNRQEIELYQEKIPCSKIVIFRKRKKEKKCISSIPNQKTLKKSI